MSARHLPPEIVDELVTAVAEDGKTILVGGQALNFWGTYYLHRTEDLRRFDPFTSKDIDFYGPPSSAERLNAIVGGEIRYPGPDEHTPEMAVIEATIQDHEVTIDYMAYLAGVDVREVNKNPTKAMVEIKDPDQPRTITALVMNPWHVFRSRTGNVIEVGRKGEHSLGQLEASIIILREFLFETLEESEKADDPREYQRVVASILMELAHFLRVDPNGRLIHDYAQTDPASILSKFREDGRLDRRWRDKQLGGQIEKLTAARKRRSERANRCPL